MANLSTLAQTLVKRFSRRRSEPLTSLHFTADPAAHVFNDRLYIYCSHDIEQDIPADDFGSQFDMRDYLLLSMNEPKGPVINHGPILDVREIPWAISQLWAPDAAVKDGVYYLFFPAKDKEGIFRIGVARSESPTGPFKAEPNPIAGIYSIDPAVFRDTNGDHYLYFGGIWGGQLQNWRDGRFQRSKSSAREYLPQPWEPAICPKVARLSDDLLRLADPPRDLLITDEFGQPLSEGDNKRRFFEGSWMHYHRGRYYFSWSTGDTNLICYATGESPYGPFRYEGVLLEPVSGWTTHHSICEFRGKWYLFYHDCSLSEGISHLRCVKMTELFYDAGGRIQTIRPHS